MMNYLDGVEIVGYYFTDEDIEIGIWVSVPKNPVLTAILVGMPTSANVKALGDDPSYDRFSDQGYVAMRGVLENGFDQSDLLSCSFFTLERALAYDWDQGCEESELIMDKYTYLHWDGLEPVPTSSTLDIDSVVVSPEQRSFVPHYTHVRVKSQKPTDQAVSDFLTFLQDLGKKEDPESVRFILFPLKERQ
jgi:hypothetical protein